MSGLLDQAALDQAFARLAELLSRRHVVGHVRGQTAGHRRPPDSRRPAGRGWHRRVIAVHDEVFPADPLPGHTEARLRTYWE